MEKNSTPESYFEALEVRGLPDTPSKNELNIFLVMYSKSFLFYQLSFFVI